MTGFGETGEVVDRGGRAEGSVAVQGHGGTGRGPPVDGL